MSFKKNEHEQITLNDSYLNASPRTQKIIQNSWCKDFAEIVFPAIDEERFSVLYSDNAFSRPNTPVNFIIGALILKENSSLSDDELMEAICCDLRFQYALHTTHLEEQPVSDRTFSRFRERLYNYTLETGRDLMAEEMKHLADVFSKHMNLNSNIKRMDSLMVASRCKKMSRLEIIYATTANAVKLIDRLGENDMLPADLRHYLNADDYNDTIYYCKGEEVQPRLEKALKEAETVKKLMSDDVWHEFTEYQLLIRVLNEQSDIDKDGNILSPKSNKEITSESLQNPSDPDATFRSKAGKNHKGYVTNVVESVGDTGSLITEIDYKQNTYSDSQFCKDHIEAKDSDKREIMIADGAYGSTENSELAEAKNIELITTCLTGKAPDPIFAEFKFNEEGNDVLSCPMGHTPIKTTYYAKTGMCRVLFSKSHCHNCPYRDTCRAKEQSKNYVVTVSSKTVQRASYLKKLSTEEYKKLTRMRNAIEGIPSVFRRRYHIDDIPVFGLIRSKVFVLCKAIAYNFNKVRTFNRSQRDKCALLAVNG